MADWVRHLFPWNRELDEVRPELVKAQMHREASERQRQAVESKVAPTIRRKELNGFGDDFEIRRRHPRSA